MSKGEQMQNRIRLVFTWLVVDIYTINVVLHFGCECLRNSTIRGTLSLSSSCQLNLHQRSCLFCFLLSPHLQAHLSMLFPPLQNQRCCFGEEGTSCLRTTDWPVTSSLPQHKQRSMTWQERLRCQQQILTEADTRKLSLPLCKCSQPGQFLLCKQWQNSSHGLWCHPEHHFAMFWVYVKLAQPEQVEATNKLGKQLQSLCSKLPSLTSDVHHDVTANILLKRYLWVSLCLISTVLIYLH